MGVFVWLQQLGQSGSLDMILLVVMLVGASIYGLVVGRDRAVMILLATYLALAVVTNTPAISLLNQLLHVQENPTLRLVWFMGLFFLIFYVLWRSHILRGMAKERGAFWEAILFSVLQVGLAVSIALFLLPIDVSTGLSPLIQGLFLSDLGRSFWLIGPIALLAFAGGEGAGFDDE